MSSSKERAPPSGEDLPEESSTTDAGTPPRRYEPIAGGEDEEENGNDPGTVRRSRPAHISTNANIPNYGTSTRSIEALMDVAENRCLGSLESSVTAEGPLSEGQRTPTQDRIRGVSQSEGSSITGRQHMLSPEPQERSSASKPKISRRASSKHMAPHKGQEFSVDDDPEEYESDVASRRPHLGKSTGSRQDLRRKPSNLRRRVTAQPITLPRVDSRGEEEAEAEESSAAPVVHRLENDEGPNSSEEALAEVAEPSPTEGDDDELSDAESFTLKDRQNAINETHPFGIRIWKPALYKKNRSVEKTAEGDIHSSPGGRVSSWLFMFNVLWTLLFGWWLALSAALGALICFILGFAPEAADYGWTLIGLSFYILYPFGQFVRLEQDEAYAEEDAGEGRSIGEYERWQAGDLEDGRLFFGPLTSRSLIGRRRDSVDTAGETDSLLGRTRMDADAKARQKNRRARLFGRGQWTVGRVIYFTFFYFLIAPLLLLASGICWFLVFTIPMGRVTLLLFYHLRRHPLALSFNADSSYSRGDSSPSSILLCTYRAVGTKYWKYTIDGTNIFLINLIGVVLFAIFDYWVLDVTLHLDSWIVHPGFVFALALFSIIPLAYFIGQAVASISAQSSMGVGAAINAFFSTVVEVFLYCVALNQGKGQLVEGSIIGSIFAGILFLPGLSMCFGALKRKTQRFNVKSAGVTSTMLLFATIAAFGPTLFYQIYGSHELNCHACNFGGENPDGPDEDCRRCYFAQVPAVNDTFFRNAVRPYCWFAAVMLFLAYIIGLWFTLRTHAATIWNAEVEEKKAIQQPTQQNGSATSHPMTASFSAPKPVGSGSSRDKADRGTVNAIRDTQLYKRILSQSLKSEGLGMRDESRHGSTSGPAAPGQTPHLVPPKSADEEHPPSLPDNSSLHSFKVAGLSEEESDNLVRQVAEMAATAAAVAARDVHREPPRRSSTFRQIEQRTPRPAPSTAGLHDEGGLGLANEAPGGGHDAPNWSRVKSTVILLGATFLYAVIAEILVNTVDVVLESVDIDEKFLGITLFALVPNTTEFLVSPALQSSPLCFPSP